MIYFSHCAFALFLSISTRRCLWNKSLLKAYNLFIVQNPFGNASYIQFLLSSQFYLLLPEIHTYKTRNICYGTLNNFDDARIFVTPPHILFYWLYIYKCHIQEWENYYSTITKRVKKQAYSMGARSSFRPINQNYNTN